MVVLIFILALIVISYGLYVSVTGLFTFFKNRTKVNTDRRRVLPSLYRPGMKKRLSAV